MRKRLEFIRVCLETPTVRSGQALTVTVTNQSGEATFRARAGLRPASAVKRGQLNLMHPAVELRCLASRGLGFLRPLVAAFSGDGDIF